VAEERGFRVLHLYVDSLFVSCPGASAADFLALAQAIEQATHLPIELQKVYPWFAFLGTRENVNISVANRFYGLRRGPQAWGIALRRSDTPPSRHPTEIARRASQTCPGWSTCCWRCRSVPQRLEDEEQARRSWTCGHTDAQQRATEYSYFARNGGETVGDH
jgi:hypothetical protein